MNKLALLTLAAAVASVLPAQAADPLVSVTGTILIGNALTRETGGVTETVSPCDGSVDGEVPAYTAQGIDGYTIDLLGPDGDFAALELLWGKRASLTATRTIPDNPAPIGTGNDVDAWFYGDGCTLIKPSMDPGAYHMATTGSLESGTIPTGTRFVVVDLYRGVNAPFAFKIFAD